MIQMSWKVPMQLFALGILIFPSSITLHCCLNAFGPNVLWPSSCSILRNFSFCCAAFQLTWSFTNSCQSSHSCPSSARDIV